MSDPYRLASGALSNLLGIVDPVLLAAKEAVFSERRVVELHRSRSELAGKADLAHFKKLHGYIFQDVYPWAGRSRNELIFSGQERGVNVSKGGTSFVLASQIEDVAGTVAHAIAKENFLRGLPRDQFAQRLSEYYAKWNLLHPFREGNGRTTRALMTGLTRQAGYALDYSKMQVKAAGWNAASKLSAAGNASAINTILQQAVRRPEAYAFEYSTNLQAALQKFPHLVSAVDSLGRLMKDPKIAVLDQGLQKTIETRLRRHMSGQIDGGKFGFSRQAINPLTLEKLIQGQAQARHALGPRGPSL